MSQTAPTTEPPAPARQPILRNEFVVELLTTLQRRHYTPYAWWRFIADSCIKSWQTAQAHPALHHSWARVTALVALLGLAGWGVLWLIEGQQIALHVLPTLALCLVLMQADVWVHLGLNLSPDGQLRERLGLPTTLTLARGTLAGLLVAHLLRGETPLPTLVLGLYALGILTDLADGQIARRTGWMTRLGGNLDGEADLFLYSSVTLSAWLAGRLPGWFVAAMLLRFGVVIVGALLSYFVAIKQVDFNHSIWGRLAGSGQAACLIVVLLPGVLGQLVAPLILPLLLATLVLAVLAPLMELRYTLRIWRLQENPLKVEHIQAIREAGP
jgi:phosphatidylglycerophosphate synthase